RDVQKAFQELKSQGNAEKDLKRQVNELILPKEKKKGSNNLKKKKIGKQAKVQVLAQMDEFLSQERREFVEERLGGMCVYVFRENKTITTTKKKIIYDHLNVYTYMHIKQWKFLLSNRFLASPPYFISHFNRKQQTKDEVVFKYIAGVVTVAQRASFERQVYLTTRGNSLVRFEEARDLHALVFVVFFLGNQLQRSLRRLCQFMSIQICYESDSEIPREVLLERTKTEGTEDRRAHLATRNLLMKLMRDVSMQVKDWRLTLAQEHGILAMMNRFQSYQGNTVLRAEGWCASNQKERIQEILEIVVRDKGVGQAMMTELSPPTDKMPPTYFETNDFMSGFQQIVDTYGVPRYKEFNPAIPTIITFPFLFGVMYGDIFHGGCLLLGTLLLFALARFTNIHKTPFASLYFARYVLLFMGIFSVYCGLIYNDCLSIMINGWNGTQWRRGNVDGYTFVVQENVYAVGIDPAWSRLDNQLSFSNSLKMKLAVIIGVSQMTFGLFLKLSNHLQEHDHLSVWFEFVPQLVFMLCFFGYMIFLIFYKWCLDWSISTLPDTPSLITLLINMFLSPGSISNSVQIFPNKSAQASLQVIFLLLLVLSIPTMLCIKPLVLRHRMNRVPSHELLMDDEHSAQVQMPHLRHIDEKRPESAASEGYREHSNVRELAQVAHHGAEDERQPFGDIVIHQLIHTIEYILGTISNTASYLRLWALSLAHAELSEVFFSKTIGSTLSSTGGTAVIINVASTFMFLVFTVCVLLVMDVLECFLHALRLHWVEFQNKFYYGDGYAFVPFSFAKLLEGPRHKTE
ncbi:V-type proton ATPase, partial [Reticulomyxa filosa]